MVGLLNNYSANMAGPGGPTAFSSQVGTAPQQGMPPQQGTPPEAKKPTFSPFGVFGGPLGQYKAQQPSMGMPPPPVEGPPSPSPAMGMPPPAPMMPQAPPQHDPMIAAMNQALMGQLGNGATGMQPTANLVPPNAASIGAQPPTSQPLFGA